MSLEQFKWLTLFRRLHPISCTVLVDTDELLFVRIIEIRVVTRFFVPSVRDNLTGGAFFVYKSEQF